MNLIRSKSNDERSGVVGLVVVVVVVVVVVDVVSVSLIASPNSAAFKPDGFGYRRRRLAELTLPF